MHLVPNCQSSNPMLSPRGSSMKLPNFNQKALSTIAILWGLPHPLLISLALPLSLKKVHSLNSLQWTISVCQLFLARVPMDAITSQICLWWLHSDKEESVEPGPRGTLWSKASKHHLSSLRVCCWSPNYQERTWFPCWNVIHLPQGQTHTVTHPSIPLQPKERK